MYAIELKAREAGASKVPARKFVDLVVGAGVLLTIHAFATAYEFLEYLTDAEQYWGERLAEAEEAARVARDKLAEIDNARRDADQ